LPYDKHPKVDVHHFDLLDKLRETSLEPDEYSSQQDAVLRTPPREATMGRYVYTDYDRCIGCHICAEVCPTGYIKMGLGA